MSSPQEATANVELETILQQIEAEPSEKVRERERKAFDEIAGPYSKRLVLFGAGPLGKTVLAGLRQAGIEPLAFADNRLAERSSAETGRPELMGLPVLSAAEAVKQFGKSACFVVTIYQGTSVRRQLADLGCERVAPFAALFWKHADVFVPQHGIELPHRMVEQFGAIRACHAALADEKSRRELREQLRWRYWMDYSALSPALAASETYFPLDLVAPLENEVFVDCGSYQGDTLPGFLAHWSKGFQHIFALEPDGFNREVLETNAKKLGVADRVTTMPCAVGSENGRVTFAATGTVTSHVIKGGDQGASVECRRLDEIPWPVSPTYIKMDIEGAEPDAIVGASGLLRRQRPVLAACTYHRSEHLWEIPNLIRSIAPEYNLFLRRYAEECWEGVCYAIPRERLL
jgi:FkbM family methyltransferase